PALSQLKSVLRIWQAQGHSKHYLSFLLLLEDILEQGDAQESLGAKFLRILQPENIEAQTDQHASGSPEEAFQKLISYRVQLQDSRVRPINSPIPEYAFEAATAPEAAGKALSLHGAHQMKLVIVISAQKEEGYADVVLQPDRSITF
ncbi:hypothetical protein, partial [Ktedonospora formicarum]